MKPEPTSAEVVAGSRIPAESYGRLFLRFLRFGALAWGGPVAQIDMIRQELVAEEKWISSDRFRRLLAVYQALPGPEAHELCVHFGVLARGRLGGLVAGFGFMLPGFVLIFLLSWLYLSLDPAVTGFEAVFRGVQPAVVALIVRACQRLGRHTLVDRPLLAIAVLAAAGEMLGVSFFVTLPFAGIAYACSCRRRWPALIVVAVAFGAAVGVLSPVLRGDASWLGRVDEAAVAAAGTPRNAGGAGAPELLGSGLRAGLLTFGGAYTAIPFLREDAVEKGGWMTEHDFLDGVALAGMLPAPLIIFSTFVGYVAGGPLGALAMTFGVFLPAFLFSIFFHRHLEAVISWPLLRHFLDGVTAGVVGLIAIAAVRLAVVGIPSWPAALIFGAALAVLSVWQSKLVVPAVVVAAGVAGAWIF